MKNVREDAREQMAAAAAGFVAPARADGGAVPDGQRATRDRVARSILDHGPSTAADLARRLGLTPAAVRRHLDALASAGLVASREQRVYGHRGRGRPAKVFALTDSGRDAFYQAYDQLAADALRWIAEAAGGGTDGEQAVAAFARARLARQADRYRAAVTAGRRDSRAAAVEALARALSRDGYAATARRVPAVAGSPAGAQLCQHHCPVAHLAEQFPQLCEAETEVFSELLGTHVQRLATIAHGDGVCTTHVPAAASRAEGRADVPGPPAAGPASRPSASGLSGPSASGPPEPSASESSTTTATVSGRNPV